VAFGPELPGWLAPVLVAPFAGSFVGVLVRRLPRGQSVAWSRSQCEHCGRDLSPFELVPIASFAVQRGRCTKCGEPIAVFHIMIEFSALLAASWAAWIDPDPVRIWMTSVLGWGLLALACIDVRHFRLPDVLTLPLVMIGMIAQLLLAPEHFPASLLGAFAGYVGFRGISIAYRAVRGREGLGAGDAKLLAVGGAWLGWSALPQLVFLAALLAISFIVIQRTAGKAMDRLTVIPFGPFLATSLWITYLYGPLLFA
jgi:leader peptidase (prepilin peptidase) / N-methyltransferase